MRCSSSLAAFVLAWCALGGCTSSSSPAQSCADLLSCCGSLATPDMRASCLSMLPSDDSDGATCSARLATYVAEGACADGGAGAVPDASGTPGAVCMAGSFCAGGAGAFEYCRVSDDAGACSSSYYVVGGQTFACASCNDMSACGDAARSVACGGGADAAVD